VTSTTTTTGNIQHDGLTGLAAADSICHKQASIAGLPGTYKAWLSDRTNGISSRFNRNFDNLSFVDTHGDKIANSWVDLTDGSLLKSIRYDEFGVEIGAQYTSVWTYTHQNGDGLDLQYNGIYNDCDSWSSESNGDFGGWGQTHRTDRKWTNLTRDPRRRCDGEKRLYCFQQGEESGQSIASTNMQPSTSSYCATAELLSVESTRSLKSLKIDIQVSDDELSTSIYREGATAKVYKEVGTGYCGDSDGKLFPSINFMGVGTLEDCILKCRSLDNTNTQVGLKRTPSATGRHCNCLYTSTDYLPADTKGGTRYVPENPGNGYAVTLANSNVDWLCYQFQPSEGDGCDMGCLEERCLNQSTTRCEGYIWDSVAQRGTLVTNDHNAKPSVMDSSLEYYQRPVYDRLDGACQSTTRLCQAYADGILCTSSNWNVATCIAMSDTLPETCSGTLDSSNAPIDQYYYDFTLDGDSSDNERLFKAIEMCNEEMLCAGFNWNHGPTGSFRHRASFRYQIPSTVSNLNDKCYLKPPVRYTYDKNGGQCSGEELCSGDSSSSIPIWNSTDANGWTKLGCDNVCLEKTCYREPLCAGYTRKETGANS